MHQLQQRRGWRDWGDGELVLKEKVVLGSQRQIDRRETNSK